MKFKFVVVYEDFTSARRAMEMSGQLTAGLNAGLAVDSYIWRFDALNLPQLRRQAAEDAIQANLIIISVRSQAALPATVKSWLRDWLPEKRSHPGILVVLVNHDEQPRAEACPFFAYLQRKAREAGLEFVYATGPRRESCGAALRFRKRTNHALIHRNYWRDNTRWWS
jgi:hypothetical protein